MSSAEKGRVSERLTKRLTIFKLLQAIEYLRYKKKNINGIYAGNFLSFSATRSLAGDTDVAQYLWAQKPASRQAVPVATTMRALGHMSYDKSSGLDVLGLGPGTGMFSQALASETLINTFSVVDTDRSWLRYVQSKLDNLPTVSKVNAVWGNGRDLSSIPDTSQDLVASHALLVQCLLPVAVGYLSEFSRVLRHGGIVIFDCFVGEESDPLAGIPPDNFWAVVWHVQWLDGVCRKLDLERIDTWTSSYGDEDSYDHYFIYRKRRIEVADFTADSLHRKSESSR